MDFAFSEDQRAINEGAREILTGSCTPAALKKLIANGKYIDPHRLEEINQLGLTGVMAPDHAGGLGLNPVDFVAIAETCGYTALPEPLVESAGVAVPLLASLQDNRGWLERATAGEVVTVGSPLNRFVLAADEAQALLLSNGDDIHLLDPDAVKLTKQESIDELRSLFSVEWTPCQETKVGEGWHYANDLGATFTAAQLVGLGQYAIEMAVDYAKIRTQFGRVIGAYQALKHHISSAQVQIEFARNTVYAAAAELPLAKQGNIAARARVAHAKICAGKSANLAVRNSLQVHGAIGFTQEADLHHYLKRVLALTQTWGTEYHHLQTIAGRLEQAPLGPEYLFSSEI